MFGHRVRVLVTLLLPGDVRAGRSGRECRPSGVRVRCRVGLQGDGHSDAVVGDPYATVSGKAEAGRVVVLYGDSDGRIGEGARSTVSQGMDSIGGVPETGTLVQLFSGNGATLTAWVGLTQNTAGVFEESETGDLFGERVAWARPGLGDTTSWLAVSAPSEDGIANNTGLVQRFPMGNLGAERNFSQSGRESRATLRLGSGSAARWRWHPVCRSGPC